MSYKSLLSLGVLFFFSIGLYAQSPKGLPKETNDPAAKKLLDRVSSKYESYQTFEAEFKLTIEVPGAQTTVEKGIVGQEGEQFKLVMDQQTIINDTKTTWVYLKNKNEVQINDSEPSGSDGGFLTPKELLRRYQKGDYLYAIIDKTTEAGKVLTQVEFKPTDKHADYSKLRLSVDEAAGTIHSIKAFGKDGSRYTFALTRVKTNKALGAGYFSFDSSKYPGIRVEDLRM